jgi:ribosome-associated protein
MARYAGADRVRLELHWQFARAGGPGGQNVNKVSSKAVLRWDFAASAAIPDSIKNRIRELRPHWIKDDRELLITSTRFRDQLRNREDCIAKLDDLLAQAASRPKIRRPSRPTRASRETRLRNKKHRARRKEARRVAEG